MYLLPSGYILTIYKYINQYQYFNINNSITHILIIIIVLLFNIKYNIHFNNYTTNNNNIFIHSFIIGLYYYILLCTVLFINTKTKLLIYITIIYVDKVLLI